MRRMAETSLEAYEYLKRENKLKPSQEEVYKSLLELGSATSKRIAKKLKKPLHAISGRITELKDMGLIEVIGKVKEGRTSSRLLKVKLEALYHKRKENE